MSDAPLNGFELLAALPVFRPGMNEVHHWVAVVDRGPRDESNRDRYVVVHTENLHAPQWNHSITYKDDAEDAVNVAILHVATIRLRASV